MKHLKWLAVLPAIPGAMILFFGLVWGVTAMIIGGAVLVVLAIAVWIAPGRLARQRS